MDKNAIQKKINKLLPGLKCQVCNRDAFVLVDGYIRHGLAQNIDDPGRLGGTVLPTIGLVCDHCGFLLEFSAGILDLFEGESLKVK